MSYYVFARTFALIRIQSKNIDAAGASGYMRIMINSRIIFFIQLIEKKKMFFFARFFY